MWKGDLNNQDQWKYRQPNFQSSIPTSKPSETRSIRFENQMEDFCQTSAFKRYVQRAMDDNSYWQKFFDEVRMTTMIEHHLKDKVPSSVQSEIRQTLPSETKKTLLDQIPAVLNNHYEMQKLLSDHKSALSQELDQHTREILHQIVSEEQYHQVNKMYFQAFEEKGQRAISEMKSECRQQLESLTQALEENHILRKEVAGLRLEISDLDHSITQRFMYFGLTSLVGLTSYVIYCFL